MAFVSLTVEGGVSLVGPQCPGRVRLFCEGVDLTLLIWNYNERNEIGGFYHSDAKIHAPRNTSNPAFVSVQLTAVSRNPLSPVLGNFSAILTVDLSLLEQQKVMNISCGDPGKRVVVPVAVQTIQQTPPEDPQLVAVNITQFPLSEFAEAHIQWRTGVSIVYLYLIVGDFIVLMGSSIHLMGT